MHPVDVKTSQLTAYPERFQALIQGVYDFYGKDLSRFTLSLWWCAMRPYDLAAVTDALNRHCVNPDTGQFLPKPAGGGVLAGGFEGGRGAPRGGEGRWGGGGGGAV